MGNQVSGVNLQASAFSSVAYGDRLMKTATGPGSSAAPRPAEVPPPSLAQAAQALLNSGNRPGNELHQAQTGTTGNPFHTLLLGSV